MKVNEILSYIGINLETTYIVNSKSNHKKISWQKNLFEQIYKNEEQQSAWKISKEELYSHVKAKTILFSYVQGLPAGFLLSMLFAYVFKKD